MTTLSNPMTARDMKLIISGRTMGSLTECSITGNGNLADVSTLGKTYKKRMRTFKNFSGSWTMFIEDMEALGWVLGDYEVDPTKNEPVSVSFNGTNVTINHIQGSHASDVSVADTEKIAQKFVAAGNSLTTLKLYTTTGGDSTVTVTIEPDNSGSPSGTPVTNGTSTSTDFSGSGWVTVGFSSNPVLVKGDVFWVVVSITGTTTPISRADTDIYEDWGYKVYSGSWGSLQSNDLSFYIETTDDTTVIQVELTDGINTHIIEGNIVAGTGSFSVTADEPVSAEVNYVAQDIQFSG